MSTPWAVYVRDITAGASQREVAAASGIPASAVSRWLSGRVLRPGAEQAIKLAQAFRRPVTEALFAAGYLQAAEVGGPPLRPTSEYSDEEVIVELERMWLEGGRFMAELLSRFLGRRIALGGEWGPIIETNGS